jgi:hypothetical protein
MGDINHKVETNGMAQPTGATCWYACYRMLLKVAGRDNSEAAIRSKFKLFSLNFDEAYAKGLHSKDWSIAAFALGFAPFLPLQFSPKLNTNWWGKTSGEEAFLALLRKGPLWIGRNVNRETSHAIIACGYASMENKVVWLNPESASGNAFPQRSRLDLFIQMIGTSMGGVQLHTAHALSS